MLWLYSALCPCFSKLAWQALASTPGAACDLLGEAAAPQVGSRQHQATHKLVLSVMLQAQTSVYDKNVLAVLRIYIFVAVVIVDFVRAVCFDASDSSKTIQVV